MGGRGRFPELLGMRRFPRFRASISVGTRRSRKCAQVGKPSQGRGDSLDGTEGSQNHLGFLGSSSPPCHGTPSLIPGRSKPHPDTSWSFSRLGKSAGNCCELLSGRFLLGIFPPPRSVNPLPGRILVSSTSSGFALTSIPSIPPVLVPSRASP